MLLTKTQRQAIRVSWERVIPIADTASDLFYKRLFELEPSYRELFPEDMAPQKRKLLSMLSFIVKAVDWPEDAWRESVDIDSDLMLIVLALGRRHSEIYHVPEQAYASVGEALLWTLDYSLGEAFTHDVKMAWTSVYTTAASIMKMGSLYVGEASVVTKQAK